jgi:4-diphosphocytidyl-2-C-methyl-D-erythritol kinase
VTGTTGTGRETAVVGGRDPSTRVRVRVPSKLNLFLAVRGSRPDGYHELVTVLQTLSIHDTVTACIRTSPVNAQHPAARRYMELAFTQEAGPQVPPDGDNLAVRAARQLMGLVGVGTATDLASGEVPVTRLHLAKRIPVAAGMAGGSADAAAALVALNHLWGTELDRDELRTVAAELGADVPFCVTGGTALATGIGTATAQVLTRGVYHWVVCISDEPLSTPAVYGAFDEVGTPSEAEPDAVLQALRTGDAEALGAALHNDLETAAFHLRPGLRSARDHLLDVGALGALVSGSGPTLVGLARSAQHAVELAEAVRDRFDRVEVALSPAGGPELSAE